MNRGTLFLICLAACGDEKPEPIVLPAEIADIFRAFDVARSECPDRSWFGYDWAQEHVLLLDPSADRAWFWRDPRSNRTDSRDSGPVVASSLPPGLGDFSFFTVDRYQGDMLLGIDLGSTRMIDEALRDAGRELLAPFALQLALHEGFHFLGGQDDFAPSGPFERDSEFPEQWRPRFLRQMIIDSLRAALVDEDPGALGRARAWGDLLAAESPDERPEIAAVDVYEGTAQFVETIELLVSRLGCSATDEELIAEARAFADVLFRDGGYSRSGESYPIGALSGMLLRQRGDRTFEPLAKIEPMFDLLVYDVAPAAIDENAPEAARRRLEAEEEIGFRNEVAAMILDPALAAWSSTTAVRLAIPIEHSLGSFSYTLGYRVGTSSTAERVLLEFSMAIASPDQMGRGELTEVVAFRPRANPCETDVFAFPLVMDVPVDAAISLVEGGISLTDYPAERIDRDGRLWLCLR